MSRAYKCDRCRRLFEKNKCQGTSDFYVTRNPNFSGDCLDLCPKCNAELQSWVANDTDGEYIKKADILNELGDTNMDILTDEVKENVNSLPSYSFPDSAENKGAWVPIDDFPHEVWECDHCGFVIDGSGCIEPTDYRDMYNFCPKCGADMREPKDIIHKAIDNTTFAEEAYPNIKEELHKAVDMAEPKGEKGET